MRSISLGYAARRAIGLLTSLYAFIVLTAGISLDTDGHVLITRAFDALQLPWIADALRTTETFLSTAPMASLTSILMLLSILALILHSRRHPYAAKYGVFPMAAGTFMLTFLLHIDVQGGDLVLPAIFLTLGALGAAASARLSSTGVNTPAQAGFGVIALILLAHFRFPIAILVLLLADDDATEEDIFYLTDLDERAETGPLATGAVHVTPSYGPAAGGSL